MRSNGRAFHPIHQAKSALSIHKEHCNAPRFPASRGLMEQFRQLMEIIGTAVDGVGVFIVAAGALVATARLLVHRAHNTGNYYSSYRQDIGRAILLGFEFLIAGDIIRTVVVAPTIQNVLVLGLIVLIRTFLSLSLQLEMEGKLPWRREAQTPV
jgi:uncharacterized membrane protein